MKLPQQRDSVSSAALIAEIRTVAALVVEPKAVFACAAERTGAAFILEIAGLDAEQRENFAPPIASTIDGLAHAALFFAFA